jgi:hypothetical protein
MARSPGFGSIACDYSPYSDSVSLRLPYSVKLATHNKSLTHYTKGTQSPHEGAPTACTHTVSGSISLPSPGFFSPFPHGTGSLSVGQEYLALEDGPPIFRQGFTCPALLIFHHYKVVAYRAITVYGRSFQDRFANSITTFGLLPVRSSLLGESRLISFPPGTEIFQFPGFAPYTYVFSARYSLRSGFPHSDISGSMSVADSPELFAGCHVLHRL